MKFAAIEAKFTANVAEYIGKGYVINATTMRGAQGEIAKVDFRKGEEVVRVMLGTEYHYGIKWDKYNERVVLTVGRNTEKLNGSWDIIWNNKLEVIEREEWVKVHDGWYMTVEEAVQANGKAHSRFEAEMDYDNALEAAQSKTSDKAAQIVLPFARRQRGCKRCKPSDIAVEKVFNQGRLNYVVTINGKKFTMS